MTKEELMQIAKRNTGNVDVLILVDYVEFLHKFLELKSKQLEQIISKLEERSYEFNTR
jgi:hypothetical protein